MIRKFFFITLFSTVLASRGIAGDMPLSWTYERGTGDYKYELKIYNVELTRGKIRFSLLFHNTGSEYICFHASADKDMLYVDDEMGNEYFGATFRTLEGKSNKLAPNQRKKAIYEFTAPKKGINLINLRMGFHHDNTNSTSPCGSPTRWSDINEHKLDWDISKLREN